jgi:hypothetical protein
MTNPKYTQEGLPVLTQETVTMHFVGEKTLDAEGETGLLRVMQERAEEIFGQNPVLDTALEQFCRKYHFRGITECYVQAAGLYVYQLLKRQAEINKLEEGAKL